MDNTTLLIVVIVLILLLGGGGWYGRGRWFLIHSIGADDEASPLFAIAGFSSWQSAKTFDSATQLDLEASTLTLAHRR
jgi:hypothetical protein